MDTKAVLRGIEEVRLYLLGEAPMLVGGVDDDLSDLVPTYFKGPSNPEAEIWKLFDYVQENPERFEAELREHHEELVRVRKALLRR